jgi:hypothetical protein
MAKLRFGKHEEVRCIVDVDARGPKGESLCLAFKTSSYWVGGGVYLADDGYVLLPRGQESLYYPMPQSGAPTTGLPSPLPAYSIPWTDYFGGYSLWFAIVIGTMWTVGASKLKARRRSNFEATLRATPVTYGPPILKTKGDNFVAATTMPLLRPGEGVQHQAYTLVWDFSDERGSAVHSCYVVLTTQRVLMYAARVGAFGPLYECTRVDSFERDQIRNAAIDDRVLVLTLPDGTLRGFQVTNTSAMSNQTAFLTNAARILAEGR